MAKIRHNHIVDTINDIAMQARVRGISHLCFTGEKWDGRTLTIDDRQMINFGTCGYLGLESHPNVIETSMKFTERFGTQYSISRAYATSENILELEDKLSAIFEGLKTIVFSSTTIAHISVLPIAIRPNDAIIMDQQAHVSMQSAAQLVAVKGVPIEVVRHSNIEMIERKIKALNVKHDKIWYIMDGVYSMYGDIAPLDELNDLAKKYSSLHFYVDDAHGMSWCGDRGSGAIFEGFKRNEKTMLVTTMAKGFGSVGGMVVFPNDEIFKEVNLHGGALAYSHPIVPAVIGASMASADIHLSNEIVEIQGNLQSRINYINELLDKTEIPVLSSRTTPIYFLGTGQPGVGYNLNSRILNEGFYVNIGLFPAVSVKNTGLRFTVTNHIEKQDIKAFCDALEYHYPRALEEESKTVNDVRRAFKLPLTNENQQKAKQVKTELFIYTTIKHIDKDVWNEIFKGKGCYDWDALVLLENSFCGNRLIEENWEFRYVLVKDEEDKVIVATFLTIGILKDDLLAPVSTSIEIEIKRINDPYYLTSKTLMLGSTITEGDHLYVDKSKNNWRSALKLLIKQIFEIQESEDINAIILRDFDPEDEIAEICHDSGFFKIDMPNTNVIHNLSSDIESHYNNLNRKHRKHIRDDIFAYQSQIKVQVHRSLSETIIKKVYSLYENVAKRSHSLNIFQYPESLLKKINESSDWEFVCLYDQERLVAAGCCHISETNYDAVLLGMDYDANQKLKLYKQILYQVVKRAIDLKMNTVQFGLSADLEKRKVGAKSYPKVAFASIKDLYNLEIIESIPITKSNH